MDELDLAETLLTESEQVVSYPVKTQGSGDHEAPVILLTDLDANRIQEGNSSKSGHVKDSDGNIVGETFEHKYKASAVLEARSASETESYKLASDLRDHFMVFEDYTSEFHVDAQHVKIGNVKQTDPVVETPEPLYKHYFTISAKYLHWATRTINSDTVQELTSIDDDITLS